MEIKVCVGSACYVKGSHEVIEAFQKFIKQYHLENEVELKAAFCLGNCTKAVSVQIDGKSYGVDKNAVESFFKEYVYGRTKACK